jgi:hypothetical protein
MPQRISSRIKNYAVATLVAGVALVISPIAMPASAGNGSNCPGTIAMAPSVQVGTEATTLDLVFTAVGPGYIPNQCDPQPWVSTCSFSWDAGAIYNTWNSNMVTPSCGIEPMLCSNTLSPACEVHYTQPPSEFYYANSFTVTIGVKWGCCGYSGGPEAVASADCTIAGDEITCHPVPADVDVFYNTCDSSWSAYVGVAGQDACAGECAADPLGVGVDLSINAVGGCQSILTVDNTIIDEENAIFACSPYRACIDPEFGYEAANGQFVAASIGTSTTQASSANSQYAAVATTGTSTGAVAYGTFGSAGELAAGSAAGPASCTDSNCVAVTGAGSASSSASCLAVVSLAGDATGPSSGPPCVIVISGGSILSKV